MRFRLPVIWNTERGWHVALPTYVMVPGTFLPVVAKISDANGALAKAKPNDPELKHASIVVDVPAEYVDPDTGRLSSRLVKRLHRGSPTWCAKGIDLRYIDGAHPE